MKKITDKDVERLKAGKKITKGFIHMQLDDKGRLNLWSDINLYGMLVLTHLTHTIKKQTLIRNSRQSRILLLKNLG